MIQLARTVRRKVATTSGQPLVVAITPEGIWLREPRRRKAFLLPYGAAYLRAVELQVRLERAQKERARKVKRGLFQAR